MKKLFKWSTLLLTVAVLFQVACSEDAEEPTPVDDLVGKWALSSATFIATNIQPTETMAIDNFPMPDGSGGIVIGTAQFPTNTNITSLVVGAIADGVCADVANYPTLFIELTADGELYLNCPAEENSELSGTWTRTVDPGDGSTSITLNIAAAGTTLPVTYSAFQMLADKSKFSGTTSGFPMVVDFSQDLGPTNIQFMTADMEFTRLP